jgi:hypothetical protein
MLKHLLFIICVGCSFSLLSQVYTDRTVEEMKQIMELNYKNHYIVNDKGSKVLIGGDSLTLYEYWGFEADSSYSTYLYYAKLGRIVSFAKKLSIKLMQKDVGNFDILFERHNPPINGHLISWDATIVKKTIIGIILDEKKNEYFVIEM